MGLKRMNLPDGTLGAGLPGCFKGRLVANRVELRQKVFVVLDGLGNEVADGRIKNRLTLGVVGGQQVVASPTL